MAARARSRGWLAAAGLLSLACTLPLTRAEMTELLRETAARHDATVVVFHASSQQEAWTQVAEALANGPLPVSRRLAKAFEPAAHSSVAFVVGGPYTRLNDRALRDAFGISKQPRLPGLSIVYVSPEPPSEELLATARAFGARLLHKPYPEARASTSRTASWSGPLLASVSRPSPLDAAPWKSLTRPPASSTMRLPAHTSQALSFSSQKASKRPHAT